MANSSEGGPDAATELPTLEAAAATCRRCDLWRNATQTVFGKGDPHAPLVLLGEQPGAAEDLAGKPFVGPAGRLLDRALANAGLDRDKVYVTNAVKHFKWVPRGKRRLHKTPAQREIEACRVWLDGELGTIAPSLVVGLGITAARTLLGARAKLAAVRGAIIADAHPFAVLVTVHPSFVLRVPSASRGVAYRGLVADLRTAATYLGRCGRAGNRNANGGAERGALLADTGAHDAREGTLSPRS